MLCDGSFGKTTIAPSIKIFIKKKTLDQLHPVNILVVFKYVDYHCCLFIAGYKSVAIHM